MRVDERLGDTLRRDIADSILLVSHALDEIERTRSPFRPDRIAATEQTLAAALALLEVAIEKVGSDPDGAVS